MQSTTTTSFAAHEGERPARSRLTKRLLAPLAWLYTDTLGIVSRPKVLFTVAFADAASVFAAGYVQNMPAASTFWIALVAFAAVVMLNHLWSYTIAALADIAAQADKAATATAGVFLTTAGISYLARTELFPPLDLVIWSGLTFCLLLTIRLLTASIIRALSDAGCLVRRTVLAGAGKACEDLIAALGEDRNIKILGVFDDRQGARALHPSGGLRRLGTFEELDEFCRAESVDLAIVTVPPRAEERPLHILQRTFAVVRRAILQHQRADPGGVQPSRDLGALLVDDRVAITPAGADDHRRRRRRAGFPGRRKQRQRGAADIGDAVKAVIPRHLRLGLLRALARHLPFRPDIHYGRAGWTRGLRHGRCGQGGDHKEGRDHPAERGLPCGR